MKLSHFFIEHPRFAVVLSTFIVLAGLATMFILPIAQYPNIVPPTIKSRPCTLALPPRPSLVR